MKLMKRGSVVDGKKRKTAVTLMVQHGCDCGKDRNISTGSAVPQARMHGSKQNETTSLRQKQFLRMKAKSRPHSAVGQL